MGGRGDWIPPTAPAACKEKKGKDGALNKELPSTHNPTPRETSQQTDKPAPLTFPTSQHPAFELFHGVSRVKSNHHHFRFQGCEICPWGFASQSLPHHPSEGKLSNGGIEPRTHTTELCQFHPWGRRMCSSLLHTRVL